MSIRGYLLGAAMAAATISGAAPASAQGSWSSFDETATAALSRYVRNLASNPRDFSTLIAAGRAALEVGDTQAAAAFFARADEATSGRWEPQAGMGAVQVAQGQAQASLAYFARAKQLGAPSTAIGADRGLAFDMLGRQDEAQADYKVAMVGRDRDTAVARMALSLAISGKKDEALASLAPLQAKGDPAGARARAFILALSGDMTGARTAIDAAMPGSAAMVTPYLSRLASMGAGQKAAAVNLGIFPGEENTIEVASVSPTLPSSPTFRASPVAGMRGRGYPQGYTDPAGDMQPSPEAVQAMSAPGAASSAFQMPAQPVVQQASASVPPAVANPSPARSTAAGRKIWLQLASGADRAALGGQFDRIKSHNKDLFDGIHGYVAQSNDRARLLIGPFRNQSDADTFAADLESVAVSAFKWSNSESDLIVPLAAN